MAAENKDGIYVAIGANVDALVAGMNKAATTVDGGVAKMNASLNRLTSVRSLMTAQDARVFDQMQQGMVSNARSTDTLARAKDNLGFVGTKTALKLAGVSAAVANAGTVTAGTAEKMLSAGVGIASMFGPTGLAAAALGSFALMATTRFARARQEMRDTEQQFTDSLNGMINSGDVETMRKRMQDLWVGTPAAKFEDGIVGIQRRLGELGSLYDATLGGVVKNERSEEIRRLQRALADAYQEFNRFEQAILDSRNVPLRIYGPDAITTTADAPGKAAPARARGISQEAKDAESLQRAMYDREVMLAGESFEKRRALALAWLDETSAVYGTQSQQYVAALADLERLEREHQARQLSNFEEQATNWQRIQDEIRRIQYDNIVAYEQRWIEALATVSDTIRKSFDGVIQGTTRVEDAFKNLGRNILLTMAMNIQKSLELWIAAEITKRVMGAATAKQSVFNLAWQAAASAFTSTAAIPIVGPILAPVAGLTALAAVLAFGSNISSAAGGWDRVPSDQMAMIHKNEMVLPAPLAESVRQMAEFGMGGGGGDTFIIQTPDAEGFERLLARNDGAMVRQMQRLARDGRLTLSPA